MNESKASRYQRLRRRAHSIGVVSGAVMLAVLALTPAGRAVAGWAVGIGNGFTPFATLISLVLFVGVVVVCWELAALPSMLYLALHVDRRAGQGTATVDDVIAAQVHATLIALPATLVAAAVIVGFRRTCRAVLVGPVGDRTGRRARRRDSWCPGRARPRLGRQAGDAGRSLHVTLGPCGAVESRGGRH